ncbi:MAG TPA: 6-pyruvoyl-tetrahydropterin synthase-related protein [Patescibacteria group bacterium]|nr:6-pyruvoyl-tetrahydropterin synthase-related protein [Patescibacteria group bacterium]
MFKKTFWHWIVLIGAVALVLGVIFYLFSPNFFAEGMMRGGDEAAHMFIPKYVYEYYKINHRFPVINPYWYNGIETLHHTPFLDYIPIAIIYHLVKDIYYTNRIFSLLLLLSAGLSMFFFLYKKNNIRAAIIGGIIYPFVPGIFYLARTSVTRVTPFILLPLAFYYTDLILEQKFRFRNFLILTIIIASMIVAHPITAINSLAFLIIYVVARVLFDSEITFRKLEIWGMAFLTACGLIAWWAIPFLAEPANYTYPAITTVTFHSEIGAGSFLELIVLSGGALVIISGLFVFLRRRTPKDWALLASVLFAFYLTTPWSLPIYKLLTWVFPYAALTWICVVMLYWGTTFFEFPKLKPWLRISISILAIPLVAGLSILNFHYQHPFINRIWVQPFENIFPKLNQAFEKIDNQGRVFTVKNIGKIDWVIPSVNHKYYSEGHYFSITRLNKEIAWMNDAFNNDYYDYFFSKMALFNDRYFVMTSYIENFFQNNPELKPNFMAKLKENGYQPVFEAPGESVTALYYQDKPSNGLIPINQKTLVVGKHGYNYAAFQSHSNLAGSNYIDDYDLEFLSNFDNLVLYGFGYHNKQKAEKLIQDYAKNGGNVTIDMLNIENSKLEGEPTFLGVQSSLEKTTTTMQLELAENIPADTLPKTLEIPSLKDFGGTDLGKAKYTPLKEWRFPQYLNLDSTLARWKNQTNEDSGLYNLIGYKNVEGHKVWFIGGNLFYHAYLTHDQKEQKFLTGITTGSLNPASEIISEIEFTSQNLDPEAGILEFNYTAEKNTPVLVSYTISPHWKAYLNGQPLKIYNIDSMMALNLPAGNNNVKLKYENLPNHNFAKIISIVTLILLGTIFYLSKKGGKENV